MIWQHLIKVHLKTNKLVVKQYNLYDYGTLYHRWLIQRFLVGSNSLSRKSRKS